MHQQCEGVCRDGKRCPADTCGSSDERYCYFHDKVNRGIFEPRKRPSTPEESLRQLILEWNLTGF